MAVTGYEIYRDDTLIDTVGTAPRTRTTCCRPRPTRTDVRALDAAGNLSDPSNPDNATVLPPDDEKPTPPGNLMAALNGSSQVDLTGRSPQTTCSSRRTACTATMI